MTPDPDQGAAARSAGSGGDLMERIVDGAIRLGRAWKALSRERRMAAIAAALLWLTLFLPWYQESVVTRSARARHGVTISESLTGWAAFGATEALILLLSLTTLLLLFLRAEGRLAHLPGGDGWTLTAIGGVSVFMVILGILNVPSPASHGQFVLSSGLEWGIFIALLAAAWLAWAGGRIRISLHDDPFLAGNLRSDSPGPSRDRTHGERASSERATAPAAPPKSAPAAPPKSAPPARAPAAPAPSNAPADAPEPLTAAASPRSSWRPAERPAWSDPERPMGWLTAPRQQAAEAEPPTAAQPDKAGDAARPPERSEEDATSSEEAATQAQRQPADATKATQPNRPAPHRAPASPKTPSDQLTIPLDRERNPEGERDPGG